jgi:hypothetical protein
LAEPKFSSIVDWPMSLPCSAASRRAIAAGPMSSATGSRRACWRRGRDQHLAARAFAVGAADLVIVQHRAARRDAELLDRRLGHGLGFRLALRQVHGERQDAYLVRRQGRHHAPALEGLRGQRAGHEARQFGR